MYFKVSILSIIFRRKSKVSTIVSPGLHVTDLESRDLNFGSTGSSQNVLSCVLNVNEYCYDKVIN